MADRRISTGGRGARRRARRTAGRTGRLWFLVLLIGLGVGGAWWAHHSGVFGRRILEPISLFGLRPPASREVTLYFADPRWTRLVPETRSVATPGGAVNIMEEVVAALAEGPRGEGVAVLPVGAGLRGAYLGRDGLAVLDFEPGLAEFYPGGASGEVLTVFAVVNSVADNVPGVERVQILIGGEARETLAGHVKIAEPLVPDRRWLEATSH